MWELEH